MKKLVLILLPCFGMLLALILFSGKYLILGAEGNYITNFQLTKDIGTYSWVPLINGTGFPVAVLNNLVGIFDLFALLQNLGLSFKTVNIISALLTYTLPFLSMLWLLRRILKVDFLVAYLIALFYVLNPLSTYHLSSLMFWNVAPLFAFPFFFGCVYKYYFDAGRLFLFFGLLTALLSFSLSNIPYLGVFQILLVISIVMTPFMRDMRADFKVMVKNFLILESSFILFNAWWFINLIRFAMQDVAFYYPKEFAIEWVTAYVSQASDLVMKLLSLTTLIARQDINYFTDFYFTPLFYIVLFIPFSLIIANLLMGLKDIASKKYSLVVLFFLVIVLFLNKGANAPFGGIYLWILENVPYFYIFKTPLEKFSPLFLMLVSLALVPAFSGATKKWAYYLIPIYLIVCSIPYLSLNFMPDYTLENSLNGKPIRFISKKYVYKENEFDAIQTINQNKLDYRYVSVPGSGNYQETIFNHDGNKFYRGPNPFLHATNKPFITAYSAPTPDFYYSIFKNFSNNAILEGSLNIYGVRRIVFNKDIYGSFGFIEPEKANQLFSIFSNRYTKQDFGPITLFSRKEYLPRFYTTKSIIYSRDSREKLPEFFARPDYQVRSVLYFQDQNSPQENNQIRSLEVNDLPVLEYKKINPVKYRVLVHQARGEFPLVFSESFHPEWKMYLGNSQMIPPIPAELESYKILEGNGGDQANPDELREYIDQGFIATLGDGKEKIITHQKLEGNKATTKSIEKHSIDFISKNFQGTIQNDNLPSGFTPETWFKKPIKNNDNHVKANGYANSWLLNVDSICADKAVCRSNPDGTFYFEIIVEFWPERLLYLGLSISGGTFLIFLGALMYNRRKKI